jgi:hypothetical protein
MHALKLARGVLTIPLQEFRLKEEMAALKKGRMLAVALASQCESTKDCGQGYK